MLQTWSLLDQVFTVETIMTPHDDQLLVWSGSESIEAIWQKATQLRIDTVPVTENGAITAVLKQGSNQSLPLTPNWLISRDTSIPELLKLFVTNGQTCLFVFYKQEVIGLVTPSDLNKLPACTYFYNLLAELEILIASHAKQHLGQLDEDDLAQLEHKSESEELSKQLEKSNLGIDPIHTLSLSDLVNIISRSEALYRKLGFNSSSQVLKNLGGLVALRNQIMHPVRRVLDDSQDINKLNERIQRALHLINQWKEI